ncbi:hypothetical protein ACI8AA_01810 [Geodermatophilus sp. SYSU D01180]
MLALVALGAGLVSCSSSDSADSAATSPATSSGAGVCGPAEDLRTSLAALRDVPVVEQGTSALEEAWATVEEDWGQFADAARAEYGGDVDDVQAEADAVREAVDAAQADPSAGTLSTAAAAVGSFVQGADALLEETTSGC